MENRFHSVLVDFENYDDPYQVMESEELVQTRELVLKSVKLSKISLRFDDIISERSYSKWRRKRRRIATLMLCFLVLITTLSDIFEIYSTATILSILKLATSVMAFGMLMSNYACLTYSKSQTSYLSSTFIYSLMMSRVILSVALQLKYAAQHQVQQKVLFDLGQALVYGPLAFGVLLDITPPIIVCFQITLLGLYVTVMSPLWTHYAGLENLPVDSIGISILCAVIGYLYIHNDRMSFVTKVLLL